MLTWLPDPLHAVATKDRFVAEYRNGFSLGLRYQHAVKGIFVRPWQKPSPQPVFTTDWQYVKRVSRK